MLKHFLKIIDEFSCDHSERLGDAGQFRTPRHIIDFMVEVLAQQKGETILDPASPETSRATTSRLTWCAPHW
jgi:type I restriction enzyme M protein